MKATCPSELLTPYSSLVAVFDDKLKGVPEGGRNTNMASVAGVLIHGGASFEETLALVIAVNARNKPPLPEPEVAAVVESI